MGLWWFTRPPVEQCQGPFLGVVGDGLSMCLGQHLVKAVLNLARSICRGQGWSSQES